MHVLVALAALLAAAAAQDDTCLGAPAASSLSAPLGTDLAVVSLAAEAAPLATPTCTPHATGGQTPVVFTAPFDSEFVFAADGADFRPTLALFDAAGCSELVCSAGTGLLLASLVAGQEVVLAVGAPLAAQTGAVSVSVYPAPRSPALAGSFVAGANGTLVADAGHVTTRVFVGVELAPASASLDLADVSLSLRDSRIPRPLPPAAVSHRGLVVEGGGPRVIVPVLVRHRADVGLAASNTVSLRLSASDMDGVVVRSATFLDPWGGSTEMLPVTLSATELVLEPLAKSWVSVRLASPLPASLPAWTSLRVSLGPASCVVDLPTVLTESFVETTASFSVPVLPHADSVVVSLVSSNGTLAEPLHIADVVVESSLGTHLAFSFPWNDWTLGSAGDELSSSSQTVVAAGDGIDLTDLVLAAPGAARVAALAEPEEVSGFGMSAWRLTLPPAVYPIVAVESRTGQALAPSTVTLRNVRNETVVFSAWWEGSSRASSAAYDVVPVAVRVGADPIAQHSSLAMRHIESANGTLAFSAGPYSPLFGDFSAPNSYVSAYLVLPAGGAATPAPLGVELVNLDAQDSLQLQWLNVSAVPMVPSTGVAECLAVGGAAPRPRALFVAQADGVMFTLKLSGTATAPSLSSFLSVGMDNEISGSLVPTSLVSTLPLDEHCRDASGQAVLMLPQPEAFVYPPGRLRFSVSGGAGAQVVSAVTLLDPYALSWSYPTLDLFLEAPLVGELFDSETLLSQSLERDPPVVGSRATDANFPPTVDIAVVGLFPFTEVLVALGEGEIRPAAECSSPMSQAIAFRNAACSGLFESISVASFAAQQASSLGTLTTSLNVTDVIASDILAGRAPELLVEVFDVDTCTTLDPIPVSGL